MVSRWLSPENRTLLEVASMVVTWWIVAFCTVYRDGEATAGCASTWYRWISIKNVFKSSWSSIHVCILNFHKWHSAQQGVVAYKFLKLSKFAFIVRVLLRWKGCRVCSYTRGEVVTSSDILKNYGYYSPKRNQPGSFLPVLVTLPRLILKVWLQSWL